MDLYFIFMGFCLFGPVYSSYESLSKTARGPISITCDQGFVVVTNEPRYMRKCNNKQSCQIRNNRNVSYVCLKSKFQKSYCAALEPDHVDQTGCYVGKERDKTELKFTKKNPSQFMHFFVLEMSLSKPNHCPAFCYHKCKDNCSVEMDGTSWFLLKVSNSSSEDFGEFFDDPIQNTDINGKATESLTTTIATEESTLTINEGTDYFTTEAPQGNRWTTSKVIMIVGIIVIILLIFFLPLTLILCRKRLQKVKSSANIKLTKTENEIPSGENRTINPSGTIQSEVQSHLGAVNQPVEQQTSKVPEVVYDQVKNKAGLKNNTKPLRSRRVLVDRDTASEDCYDDVESEHIYVDIIDKEEPMYEELNKGTEGGESIYLNARHPIQSLNEGGYICMNRPFANI